MSKKGKRKLGKAITIMLLPALIFIFIFGLCLYSTGNRKRADKVQRKQAKKDTYHACSF